MECIHAEVCMNCFALCKFLIVVVCTQLLPCSQLHFGLLQFEEVKAVMEVKCLFWDMEPNSKIWFDFFLFFLSLCMYHTWCVSSEFNASQLLGDLCLNIQFPFPKEETFWHWVLYQKTHVKILRLNTILAKLRYIFKPGKKSFLAYFHSAQVKLDGEHRWAMTRTK